jgi:hypothetical protein
MNLDQDAHVILFVNANEYDIMLVRTDDVFESLIADQEQKMTPDVYTGMGNEFVTWAYPLQLAI